MNRLRCVFFAINEGDFATEGCLLRFKFDENV